MTGMMMMMMMGERFFFWERLDGAFCIRMRFSGLGTQTWTTGSEHSFGVPGHVTRHVLGYLACAIDGVPEQDGVFLRTEPSKGRLGFTA